MRIIEGRSVLYLRQVGKHPMVDPTMKYVGDIKAFAAEVIERSVVEPKVEWLDEWTVRLTLPEGWTWTVHA